MADWYKRVFRVGPVAVSRLCGKGVKYVSTDAKLLHCLRAGRKSRSYVLSIGISQCGDAWEHGIVNPCQITTELLGFVWPQGTICASDCDLTFFTVFKQLSGARDDLANVCKPISWVVVVKICSKVESHDGSLVSQTTPLHVSTDVREDKEGLHTVRNDHSLESVGLEYGERKSDEERV